ncbi:MAG: methylated-DNA--[Clostridia bacterium]|nr:methylated-DNA--[protein]-cysteine S-methyltransferase [Clostridia bacterium]
MEHITFIASPIGKIGLAAEDGKLVRVFFDASGLPEQWLRDDAEPVLAEAGRQLNAYFAGERKEFDLPLAPAGSDFSRSVLCETEKIPYGETVSYGGIAARIGKPNAARAVGGALHKNPLPIVIPCHRVTAADGKPGGYAYGLQMKKMLLRLEKHFLARS